MMHNNFKKERYSIPNFDIGGSTRPDVNTLASTGDPIYVVSGATGITITITGTRYKSTSLFQETFLSSQINSTDGIIATETEWTSVLGMQIMNAIGKDYTTKLCDVAVYGVSTDNSTAQVAYSSSGCKGTKVVAFPLQGQEVTYSVVSGNLYVTTVMPLSGTTPVAPTSNNCVKTSTANNITWNNERVRDWILLNSDGSGAVAQIKVWEG